MANYQPVIDGQKSYDAIIIGGGLAGLGAAIQLGKLGHSVLIIEKEKYPYHKVCGEYISMESWNFITCLGIPLKDMQLPIIDTLQLTSPDGNAFSTKLPLGGFGLSRYVLDNLLANNAKKLGIHIAEETKVEDLLFEENFYVKCSSKNSTAYTITAPVCLSAFGKRSNLDVKWSRGFIKRQNSKLDNFVGIKYHITIDWPQHVIGLHNFKNGYCGISKIEENKYCLCYMTTAAELKKAGNSIQQLQQSLLYKNHHLKDIFRNCSVLQEFPVTISQISFNKKTLVENHSLMIGDAAGMIAPLCGNGMSIALHSSKIVTNSVHNFLISKISRTEMELAYSRQWYRLFSNRMRAGRIIQRFFGNNYTSNFFVSVFKTFPVLAKPVITLTHGTDF